MNNFNDNFECGYINKPYANLRPFTCFPTCPRFSCPPSKPNFNCGCFPSNHPCDCPPCPDHHNQNWNNNYCNPYQNCNDCSPCLSPRDLLFFWGGFTSGKDRFKP